MSSRLVEKLKRLGLSAEDSPSSAPKTPVVSKKKMTFRIYFPLPPFDGIHFSALKAGQGAYNFTGQLLGVGGKQLQKIKQESNARVEVVNAYGNLHGLHPDPLDEDLHALITADSLAKLQKAAEMVVRVLSPTNAQFETFRVEPGGSARLTVAQPVKSTAGAASKPKLTKPSQHSNRTSLDGSSCSSKVMPPSPALTPVTPAGTGSRHGSMFAPSSSGPNSCCSSRAPTPSPCVSHTCSRGPSDNSVSEAHDSFIGPRSSCSSGESGSKDAYSQLQDFHLPPAALPANIQLPLAAEDWPALPCTSSSQPPTSRSQQHAADPSVSPVARSSSTGGNQTFNETSSAVGRGSSSHSSQSGPEHIQQPGLLVADVQEAQHCGSEQQYGEACGSLPHTFVLTATGTAEASAGEAEVPFSAAASARGSNAGVEGWAESVASTGYTELAPASITVVTDTAAEQGLHQGMLSPLTPQQQYQQRQQQGSHQDRQQGSEVGYCPAEAPGSSSSGVFSFGVNWEGSGMGRSSLVASLPATYGTPFELPYTTSQFVQGSNMLSFGLDLDTIRNNSTIVANACLHCDMPAGAGCCGGYAAAPPGMPAGACAGDSLCGMGPIPGFSEAPFAGSSSVAPASNGHGAGYVDHQQQEYQQQQEHHMRMVAEAAASVYRSSDGGGSTAVLRSSCTGDADTCGLPYQPGVDSLGCSSWGLAQYASAQTAAVAAAASTVFGTPGLGTDAPDGPANRWCGGASSFGALTSSGFLAFKGIW